MICKYCGNELENGAAVCPYCGSREGDAQNVYAQDEFENFEPIYVSNAQSSYSDGSSAGYSMDGGGYNDGGYDDGGFDDGADTEDGGKKKGFKLPSFGKVGGKSGLPKPNVPNLPVNTIISVACAVFSFLCLVMICSLNGSVKDSFNSLNASIAQVQISYNEIEDKLSTLDTTVANVQQNAYNQLASTNITVTKDITSLTGPVTLGKYNAMFIIKAKGNLDLSRAFTWQKFNPVTGGWEEIVFTGSATSNEQYGLRLENLMEDNDYKSVLWANGITKAAEGTYRCVITDVNGIKKNSLEATVSVSDAAA